MPDYGWRGMFWFGGALTLAMAVVAFLLIPESLKYLFERRPENALERVNKILSKLKKDTLTALPELREEAPGETSFVGNLLKLVRGEHRRPTLILWTRVFSLLRHPVLPDELDSEADG